MNNEQKVLDYLSAKHPEWVSPTEIGKMVGGKHRHSSWASPICKRLVEKGYIGRNAKGHYTKLEGLSS